MIYTLTLNPAIDRTVYVDEVNFKDVTRVKKVTREAAGKGINVSKVIDSMNQKSKCVAFAGGRNGEFISDALCEKEIPYMIIQLEGNTRENIKVIPNDKGNVLELNESGCEIPADRLDKMYSYLDEYLIEDDILVLSGSVPSNLSDTIYYDIINRYRKKGVKTILDTSKDLFKEGLKGLPSVIKPNLYELEVYFGTEIKSVGEAIEYSKKLVESGVEEVLVTLGKDGSIYVSKDEVYKVSIPSVDVKGTVGAGDSYVAGYAIALQQKLPVVERLKYASAVSIASCLQPGSAPGKQNDVNDVLKNITVDKIENIEV